MDKSPEPKKKNEDVAGDESKDAQIEKLKAEITALKKQLQKPEVKPDDSDSPKAISWRKLGGGTFRLGNGKIIKPNQVFTAALEDIPMGFRDIIKPVSGELPQEVPTRSVTQHEIQSKGIGWFNVINSATGKPMNEKGLRKEDAEKLLAELS